MFSIVLILVVLRFENNNKSNNKGIASLNTWFLILTYFANFILYIIIITARRSVSINRGIKAPRRGLRRLFIIAIGNK